MAALRLPHHHHQDSVSFTLLGPHLDWASSEQPQELTLRPWAGVNTAWQEESSEGFSTSRHAGLKMASWPAVNPSRDSASFS